MVYEYWYIYLSAFAAAGFIVYAVAYAFDRYTIRLDARFGELGIDSDGGANGQPLGADRDGNSKRFQARYPGIAAHLVPTKDQDRKYHQRRLIRAGFYEPSAIVWYFTAKLLMMVVPPIAALLVASGTNAVSIPNALLWGTIVGGLGMLLPSFWLDRMIVKRHSILRKSLPDFLDLTLICLRGGLSVQASLKRVGEELLLAHPMLAAEMGRVMRDIELGATVDAALRRFADRSGEEGIRTLSTFVRESRRFGVEMADALRNHADMLRGQREQQAEAMAQKAAVKILIPTLLLIFPAVFVVLAGPAAIQIQEAFAK